MTEAKSQIHRANEEAATETFASRCERFASRHWDTNPRLARRFMEMRDLAAEITTGPGTVPLMEALQALDALGGEASLSAIASAMPDEWEPLAVHRALNLMTDSIFAASFDEGLWMLTNDGYECLADAATAMPTEDQ